MKHPMLIVGAGLAALWLYAQRAAGASVAGSPAVAPAPAPAPMAGPASDVTSVTDAMVREWLQGNHALDGTIPYADRIALIESAMAQYDVTRGRLARVMGVSRSAVDNYLDGRLDYFKAG